VKILIKLGGSLLDSDESRARLAREIAAAAHDHQIAVVHGGGKQMTRYLTAHGIESRFVNGQRVTTPDVLDAVLKVFAGSVNAQLVSTFRAAGANPVGLSGLDAGVLDAETLDPALGHVGKPVRSDPRLIELLIGAGYLPVIACVSGDPRGATYNVNGDQAASAIGAAFGAHKLIFLTDVDGVRGADGGIAATLTATQVRELISTGIAAGGMRAKLDAAVMALHSNGTGGVAEVIIAPGSREGIVASVIAGGPGDNAIGTRIIRAGNERTSDSHDRNS
jgi:acetylglutamate kinase